MSQHSRHPNQRIMRSIKKSCVLDAALGALAGATVSHTTAEAQEAIKSHFHLKDNYLAS